MDTQTSLETGHTDGPFADRSFIEFFAGIGLIHESIASFGWKCLYANDNDPKKAQAYKNNFPSVEIDERDIQKVPVEDLPAAQLATASFPCIDLSQAGGRKGIHAAHSGVVWSFLEHIESLTKLGKAPKFLLLENVAGLLTLHEGASIDILLHEISRLGYAIDLVQVDAKHFIPQARNRVFVIGVKDPELGGSAEMPDTHIRRYKVRQVYDRNRSLPWHFFDFPDLPIRQLQLSDVLLELPDDDPRWWDAERMAYFWDHLEVDHRTRLNNLVKAKATMRITAVRRGRRRGLREQIFNLRADDLASCLRTPKGGSSIQFVVQLTRGDVKVRRILGIESGRLQGVGLPSLSPDFVFPQSEQDALFGFGDAVCVPAVRWVFKHSIESYLTEVKIGAPEQTRMDFEVAV
ncbi:DNA (cytosine-5-)-methyltransferase [Actinokineospora sp. PR83]|uniref:DNA cytosine methyltransferase n=1 Tax=Actinokineospora sp. PR83 TaxID=2884908 RepID=UPI0027E0BB5D|nr:DNA (cytosine-5-)-methyltransferase [Actinokineospora sp. PR83]MCG8917887.1 DNA (cytosine-5-)-methyltransferase [Actinokineospora sp. PR83]